MFFLLLRGSLCISKLTVPIHAGLASAAPVTNREIGCRRCNVVHEHRDSVRQWRNCELLWWRICAVTISHCGGNYWNCGGKSQPFRQNDSIRLVACDRQRVSTLSTVSLLSYSNAVPFLFPNCCPCTNNCNSIYCEWAYSVILANLFVLQKYLALVANVLVSTWQKYACYRNVNSKIEKQSTFTVLQI